MRLDHRRSTLGARGSRAIAAAILLVAAPGGLAAPSGPERTGTPPRTGEARPWSPELAAQCSAGNGDACRLGGLALEQGHGTRADLPRALSLLRRGCDLRDRGSCLRLAYLSKGGHGLPPDTKTSLRAYETACELGSGDGCSGAGFLLAYGDRDVIPDRARAEPLLRRACDDGGHPRACAALGDLVARRGDRDAALRILDACCGRDGGCCAQRDRLAGHR